MAKIKKVIENGGIQYPATITDAVKNPNNGKTVTEELSELGSEVYGIKYNVASFPKQNINVSNKVVGDVWEGFSNIGTGGSRSEIFKCEKGDLFKIKTYSGASYPTWAFIDENNLIIGMDNSVSGWREKDIEVPSEASYLLFMIPVGWEDQCSLEKCSGFKELENQIENVKLELNDINGGFKELENAVQGVVAKTFDINKFPKGFLSLNSYSVGDIFGEIKTSAASRSEKIECSEGDVFKIKSYTGAKFGVWAFLDLNNVILEKDSDATGWRDTTITAPSNTKYIIVQFSVGYESDSYFEKEASELVNKLNESKEYTDNKLNESKEYIDNKLNGIKGSFNVFIGSSTEYGQGGDYGITEEQIQKYGDRVNAGRVFQYLSGRETKVYGYSGSPAMSILWNAGIAPLILNKDIVLKKDKTPTSINIVEDLKCPFGEWATSYNLYSKEVLINGYNCIFRDYGELLLSDDLQYDVVLRKGSFILQKTPIKATRTHIACVGIGLNGQGLSAETIAKMYEYTKVALGAEHFFVIGVSRKKEETSDIGKASDFLKSIYGSFYIDYYGYMCSKQSLIDANITPTTSEEYPDEQGNNSNPLTPEQISQGFIPDMQCFAEQRLPSSYWTVTNGVADEVHHNAIGYEMKGKYIYRYIHEYMGIEK